MHSQHQTSNDLYVFAFACVCPSKSVDRTFCPDRCNLPIPCFQYRVSRHSSTLKFFQYPQYILTVV